MQIADNITSHFYDLQFGAANPTTIVTDFEMSCMTAVRDMFGDSVTTRGCFFHLTQSSWRKIQVTYDYVCWLTQHSYSDINVSSSVSALTH